MTHTQGKLIGVTADKTHGHYIEDGVGATVCDLYFMNGNKQVNFKNAEANARRLVACWNLLEAFPTETIEGDNILSNLRKDRDALKQTNEGLLADLKSCQAANRELLGALKEITTVAAGSPVRTYQRMEDIAIEAIARAEKGQTT